ncbi:LysE family translocator [Staphylococcus saprophyticus]|nr:LysE family translocator [Staphylococcus saprophyticus]MDW4264702.1 LysE family translocator [Staphylococcus saprophyticus]
MYHWINFIIMSLLILIVPGPSFFAVIKNSTHGGIKSGISTTLGIASAHLIYATLATLGLIFILVSSQTIFLLIKILGAAYIIYLGLKNILNAHKFEYDKSDGLNTEKPDLFKSYKQGFITMILNPKAILFYISILPQFINHQSNQSIQVAIFSILFIITVIRWFSLCTLVFNYIKIIFEKPKVKMCFDYIVSTTLIALSLKILTTKH